MDGRCKLSMPHLWDFLSAKCRSKRSLSGKTVIITGSNSGIGKEAAADLYNRGARVIMACRNTEKAKAAKQEIIKSAGDTGQGTLIIQQLDTASLNSVRQCALRILTSETNIDILINNAGVFMAPQETTEDGFEIHIGTNHFGHALFTLLLMPRILKSASARIIFVSSFVHARSNVDLDDINIQKSSYSPFDAYCRSKAANVLFARGLHLKLRELGKDNVNVYSLNPGVVATEVWRHTPDTVCRGAKWFSDYVWGLAMKSPRAGAQTTVYCAVDEACDSESGFYYSDCAVTRPAGRCRGAARARRLWALTLQQLGLRERELFDLQPGSQHLTEC